MLGWTKYEFDRLWWQLSTQLILDTLGRRTAEGFDANGVSKARSAIRFDGKLSQITRNYVWRRAELVLLQLERNGSLSTSGWAPLLLEIFGDKYLSELSVFTLSCIYNPPGGGSRQ